MNVFNRRPIGTIPHTFTAWSCDQGKKAPALVEFGSVWSQFLCEEFAKGLELVQFEEILEKVRENVHKYQREQMEQKNPPPSPRYEKVCMPKSPYFGPTGYTC